MYSYSARWKSDERTKEKIRVNIGIAKNGRAKAIKNEGAPIIILVNFDGYILLKGNKAILVLKLKINYLIYLELHELIFFLCQKDSIMPFKPGISDNKDIL